MRNEDADLVRDILAEHEALKRARQSFEAQWDEVIELALPRYRKFSQSSIHNPGDKRTQRLFDATPMLALRHFAAAMDSMITPRTQKWHKLTVADEALREDDTVKAYLERVTDALFTHRYQWRANFAAQCGETYFGHGAFGAGALMVDDDLGRGIRYRNVRLNRLWFAEDAYGVVDTAHITWTLTARQCAQKWGANKLPLPIRNALDNHDAQRPFEFLHAIRPRVNREHGKLDNLNLPVQSVWIAIDAGHDIIEHGGYRVFPVAIGRFYAADDSAYGYSPGMEALADTRMLQTMEQTNIRAAQKTVDPPLLLADDGALEAFDLRAGSINYGYLDQQGQPLARPLDFGKNVPLGLEYANQKREAVNLAFYVTLFQILVDNPQMTATEVLQRAQEKGVLLGPTMGRVQSEQLGALITREIDILAHAGVLPEPPPALVEAGGEIDIEYDSPLNQAMKAEDGANVLRWVQACAPFIQADPQAAQVMHTQNIVRGLADTFGVKHNFVRSEDDMAALEQQQQEAQQAEQLLAAAPVAAGAAKDLSQAAMNVGAAPI